MSYRGDRLQQRKCTGHVQVHVPPRVGFFSRGAGESPLNYSTELRTSTGWLKTKAGCFRGIVGLTSRLNLSSKKINYGVHNMCLL